MRSFILILFAMALLAKGGYAQADTEDGVGTLFSFSSATVDSIDVLFNNMTKVMLNDTLSDESIELTKKAQKVGKTVRVTYIITYQSGEQSFRATFDTSGQVLTILTNNVTDQTEMFKYSSKKEYYIQWFTVGNKVVRSKKMNFAVYNKQDSKKDWKPNKNELVVNISHINNTIRELEKKFSS